MRTGSKHDIKDERIDGGKAFDWGRAGETMHPIEIPACYKEKFELMHHEEWKLKVHFTRESWNGRMKACRGIGASLTPEEIENWEREHLRMLRENAPEEFDILHFAAMAELRKKTDKSNPTRNFRRVGFCVVLRQESEMPKARYIQNLLSGNSSRAGDSAFTSNYRNSANHSSSNAPV